MAQEESKKLRMIILLAMTFCTRLCLKHVCIMSLKTMPVGIIFLLTLSHSLQCQQSFCLSHNAGLSSTFSMIMYTNYYETLEEEEPCSKIQSTPLLSPTLQMQKDFPKIFARGSTKSLFSVECKLRLGCTRRWKCCRDFGNKT